MKTYRTIDLLKAAYDGKIFKNKLRNIETGEIIHQGEVIDEDYSKQFYYINGQNFIPCSLNSSSFRNAFNEFLAEEWEEVQESMSFMDAIKIGSNGYKKIRYENWNNYVYVGEAMERLSRQYPKTAYEMMQGKWYIKEDEE